MAKLFSPDKLQTECSCIPSIWMFGIRFIVVSRSISKPCHFALVLRPLFPSKCIFIFFLAFFSFACCWSVMLLECMLCAPWMTFFLSLIALLPLPLSSVYLSPPLSLSLSLHALSLSFFCHPLFSAIYLNHVTWFYYITQNNKLFNVSSKYKWVKLYIV